MKLISVERNTKMEKRYAQHMGMLNTPVTYIRKTLLGLPFKTIHKYRKTYYGTIKDCSMCELSK